jgi:hypothetical protein
MDVDKNPPSGGRNPMVLVSKFYLRYMYMMMMMHSLRELYVKYDTIVKYSVYAFTGWLLSWMLFFIMLPFMIQSYGKIKGTSLNYGFSWFSMIAIILGLEFGLGD